MLQKLFGDFKGKQGILSGLFLAGIPQHEPFNKKLPLLCEAWIQDYNIARVKMPYIGSPTLQ